MTEARLGAPAGPTGERLTAIGAIPAVIGGGGTEVGDALHVLQHMFSGVWDL